LEKLLGVKSFDGYINHLICHQGTPLVSSCKFNLFSIVWTIAPTFLECWALIAPAFVTYFQQENHPMLLDVVIDVETNIFPFQMAL